MDERKLPMKYATTILKVAVHRETESPVFGEGNTYVSVDDEAGGPFIVLEQENDLPTPGAMRLDYDELLVVVETAKMLMHQMYIEQAYMETQDKPEIVRESGITATCGHTVDDIDDLVQCNITDYTEEGDRAVAMVSYCKECHAYVSELGKVLHSDDEVNEWLRIN